MHTVITEFPLPERADHPDWVDYQRLCSQENRETIGGPEWDVPDEDALVASQHDPSAIRRRFLARLDGVTVGYGRLYTNHRDDPELTNVMIFVDPAFRGRGVGPELARALRDAIGPETRRISAWVAAPVPTGEAIPAPTGFGGVPADHAGIRLALAHGLRLAQVERISRYDFAAPLVPADEALATAQAAAGDAYEVRCWEGASSDEYLADLASLRQRMSTDPPAGELTVVESDWDADRLRQQEADVLLTERTFKAVAIERSSGTVVAMNELFSARSRPANFVYQGDTIVAPEHRGHRLGMLVKAANIIALHAAVPESPAIVTYNAEENRHMLSVNEALGFRPIGVEGAFELKL